MQKQFFEVSSLHRSDLYDEIGQEVADNLTDEQMQALAEEVGEALNNDFSSSLDYALDRLGYERK